MSRVDFYHLQKQSLENVLPKLLTKAYETGENIKVMVGTPERVEFINSWLWTFDDESFLPHGSKKDGYANHQPIYISADKDTPNDAKFLFLVDGALLEIDNLSNFERVFNIFDGQNDEAVLMAREYWKQLKNENFELHYWQQNMSGKWEQKV